MACEREGRASDSITLTQLSVGMYHTSGHPPAIYPLEATLVSVLQDFGYIVATCTCVCCDCTFTDIGNYIVMLVRSTIGA